MENQLKSWLQSSQSPDQVSQTIKGLVLTGSSVIIFAPSSFFHVQLSADTVAQMATDIGMLAGAVWTIYGLVMKAVMWLGKVRQA